MKKCSGCKKEKSLTEFNKNKQSKDGLHRRCRVCTSQSTKNWSIKNRQRSRQKSREWKLNNSELVKEANRKWSLNNRFGLSVDQYNEMLKNQNGKCLICEKDQLNLPKRLAVDHCHKTGKIRGLLCSTCNVYLGYIEDSLENATRLVEYLRNK